MTSSFLTPIAAGLIPQVVALLFYGVVIRYARARLRQYPGDQPADLRQILSWAGAAIVGGVRRARAWSSD